MAPQPFQLKKTSHGLADVPGFRLAGVACDIRQKNLERLDLALCVADQPCTAAAVFTTNQIFAAPVKVSREVLKGSRSILGFVANSGNANACTGPQGEADARLMQKLAAEHAGGKASSYFVASTGRIGRLLPMANMSTGIAAAAQTLGRKPAQGDRAADAILTSDTRRKVATVTFEIGGQTLTVAGMAKGAGMIQPNMATMLAFIGTDAQVPKPLLQKCLKQAVAGTFNALTVDGDMSTNDTVILLANGCSGVPIPAEGAALAAFQAALTEVSRILAEKIVGDGEKISKVVDVRITGCRSAADAEKIARAIGNSLLVKSSWCGEDPNWGRLLDAAGYAGAKIVEEKLELYYQADEKAQPVPVFIKGEVHESKVAAWKKIVTRPTFQIHMHLNLGAGTFRLLATDLTEGYVTYNKSE